MARLALFAAGFAALVFPAPAARADVIWTFTETSCTSSNGRCMGNPGFSPLPATIGTLTLPDINSSGHYSYFGLTIPPVETGDTSFFFYWGGRYSAPVVNSPPGCPGGGGGIACFWDITFASTATALQITVDFTGPPPISGTLAIGPSGGTISADGLMPGCGTFAECRITGSWSLASVPEPGSFDILTGALIAIFAFFGSPGRSTEIG